MLTFYNRRAPRDITRLGFDVACGFLHVDKAGRNSPVCDLMECERGSVDGLVLDFLGRTTLHYGDVTPVSDGSCRLHPQLARALVAACRVPQDHLNEAAHWLRGTLLRCLDAEDEAKLACAPDCAAVRTAVPARKAVRRTGGH